MAPVQPMPTMTASTSFNRVAIAPSSREVRDRLRIRDIFLVAVGVDLVRIDRRQAGEAEHLPPRLVAVAAIDRVAEEALHGDVEERVEEAGGADAVELGLAVLDGLERLGALGAGEAIEILAIGLARPVVGGGDAGGEELSRRERKLVALLGLAFQERAAAVHLGAAAPGAGK